MTPVVRAFTSHLRRDHRQIVYRRPEVGEQPAVERVPHDLTKGPVRRHAALLARASRQAAHAQLGGAQSSVLGQPGLADPRLTADQHDLALADQRGPQACVEESGLAPPSNDLGHHYAPFYSPPPTAGQLPDQLPISPRAGGHYLSTGAMSRAGSTRSGAGPPKGCASRIAGWLRSHGGAVTRRR
jgi:hypothetical protein